jgi:hypothetical protein
MQRPIPTRPAFTDTLNARSNQRDSTGFSTGVNQSGVTALASDIPSPRTTPPETTNQVVSGSFGSMNLELAHATPEAVAVDPTDALYTTDGAADALNSPTELSESSGDSTLVPTPQTTAEKTFPSRVLITDDNAINRKVCVSLSGLRFLKAYTSSSSSHLPENTRSPTKKPRTGCKPFIFTSKPLTNALTSS